MTISRLPSTIAGCMTWNSSMKVSQQNNFQSGMGSIMSCRLYFGLYRNISYFHLTYFSFPLLLFFIYYIINDLIFGDFFSFKTFFLFCDLIRDLICNPIRDPIHDPIRDLIHDLIHDPVCDPIRYPVQVLGLAKSIHHDVRIREHSKYEPVLHCRVLVWPGYDKANTDKRAKQQNSQTEWPKLWLAWTWLF